MGDRHWYLPLAVKDWMGDPQVSLLADSTRGIWMDALCSMFMLDRCGQLVGTVQELARLCRTTADGMRAALVDLSERGAADVSEKHGVVTLTNRRMRREYEIRTSAAERKRKQREASNAAGRAPRDVTPPVTHHSNSNSHSQSKKSEAHAARASARSRASTPAAELLPADLSFPTFPTCGDPKTWQLTEAQIAKWSATFPAVDVPGECRKAHGWIEANPRRRKTARGMPKFLFGWLERAQNRAPAAPYAGGRNGTVQIQPTASQQRTPALLESRSKR